jgi:hypothetical protein
MRGGGGGASVLIPLLMKYFQNFELLLEVIGFKYWNKLESLLRKRIFALWGKFVNLPY